MYRYIKRVLDVVLSIVSGIVLLPVFLITCIGIKISSPGPVLYHSYRAGKNKKIFAFYKFRSMHLPKGANKDMSIAEQERLGLKKNMNVPDQDRLFTFGRIIRRLKIDELPQLINIIKGDMSIVGPRPMTAEHFEEIYCGKYEIITSVTPGLTSPASLYDYTVGDKYTDETAYDRDVMPVKLELELYYVENQGFLYDCSLVWRTIVTILQVLFGKKQFSDQPELRLIKSGVKRHD